LAVAVDAAVGTVYTYFPSKGALIAELQREAIERLTASYHLLRDRSDAALEAWDEPADAALARLAAFGAFWIAATETLPQEAAMLHGLIATSRTLVPPEEHHRVAPAALALLAEAGSAVVAASEAGAIDPQEPAGAVVTMAAALTGVLLTANLAQVEAYPFVPRRLAFALQRDLLSGVGRIGRGPRASRRPTSPSWLLRPARSLRAHSARRLTPSCSIAARPFSMATRPSDGSSSPCPA
jgi:AcrR family transcriptional regulator